MSVKESVARQPRRPSSRGAGQLSRVGIGAAAVSLGFVLLAVVGAWIAPYDPTQINVGERLATPDGDFWLGTDALGRDQLSRVLVAIQPTMAAAFMATALALALGSVLGLVGGFYGGMADSTVSRLIDFIFSIPEYLLAILVLAILGRGLVNAALAIGLVFVPRFARTVRGATQEIVARPYIDAARLNGRRDPWIILRHILPNVSSPLVVLAAINLSLSAGTYAALSFLGFGVSPPSPDFGSMISDALQYLYSAPWLIIPPAAVFVVLILAINLTGDLVRDVLDPKA